MLGENEFGNIHYIVDSNSRMWLWWNYGVRAFSLGHARVSLQCIPAPLVFSAVCLIFREHMLSTHTYSLWRIALHIITTSVECELCF